ncbi:hypothetical protein [Hymenobacter sp. B81]|uniref:hypothetical protein n=1 Tax=Hymenobacter sp. B81 TaxID=3344878 RepID=UPI0037DBF10B
MSTLAQSVYDAIIEHIRPRGNDKGPITAEDEQAVLTVIGQAIEALEAKAGGAHIHFVMAAPGAALGRASDVAWNVANGDIWQKNEGGEWKQQYNVGSLAGGGGATFPANEPATASPVGNLPAGSEVAGRSVLDVMRDTWSAVYQLPAFSSFTLNGQGTRDVAIGTSFPAGPQAFAWATTNSANVTAGSISIQDVTMSDVLASGEANDGAAQAETDLFVAGGGEARRYRITATNSKGQPFTRDIVITGRPEIFFGPAAAAPANSAAVRALPSRLTSAGLVFNLNTGTVLKTFVVAVPANYTVAVIDLDAFNAPMPYASTEMNVNDAAGSPVAYKLYTLTVAEAYGTSHRHQVTITQQ